MLFIPLLASIAAFGLLQGSKFFSPFALTLIIQQVQIVGIGGAAQSLVNLTAGIDLSGGYCGDFLNSANKTIRSQDISKNAALLLLLVTRFKAGGAVFTVGVLLMLPLVIVLAYVLRHTARGRHVHAAGDDPKAVGRQRQMDINFGLCGGQAYLWPCRLGAHFWHLCAWAATYGGGGTMDLSACRGIDHWDGRSGQKDQKSSSMSKPTLKARGLDKRYGRCLCVLDPKDYSMSDAVPYIVGAMEPSAEHVVP